MHKPLKQAFHNIAHKLFKCSPHMIHSDISHQDTDEKSLPDYYELQFRQIDKSDKYKGYLVREMFYETEGGYLACDTDEFRYGPEWIDMAGALALIEEWSENYGECTGRYVRDGFLDNVSYYRDINLKLEP